MGFFALVDEIEWSYRLYGHHKIDSSTLAQNDKFEAFLVQQSMRSEPTTNNQQPTTNNQ